MKYYQAKEIQEMVGIPKHRYEYISSKMGIKPEVEEVERTGHVHKYSFKNLLEFSFVNTANNLGIGPKAVKKMLEFLSNNFDLREAKLFETGVTVDVSLHYCHTADKRFFKLSGKSVSEQGKKGFITDDGFDVLNKITQRPKTGGLVDGLSAEFEKVVTLLLMDLSEMDGYITINLGAIKSSIIRSLKE